MGKREALNKRFCEQGRNRYGHRGVFLCLQIPESAGTEENGRRKEQGRSYE